MANTEIDLHSLNEMSSRSETLILYWKARIFWPKNRHKHGKTSVNRQVNQKLRKNWNPPHSADLWLREVRVDIGKSCYQIKFLQIPW